MAIMVCGEAVAASTSSDSLPSPSPALEWSATVASKYLFQGGLDYSEGKPVVQPQISAGWKGLSFQLWGNWDHVRNEINELDATMQQAWAHGTVSGELGVVHLRYPHRDWKPTQELFARVTFGTLLEPALDLHWDIDEGDGGYWSLGFSHDFPTPKTSLSLSSKVYGLEHYYGLTGLTALEAGLTLTSRWAGISWEPSLLRQWAWENHDLRGANRIQPGWLFTLNLSSP